MSRHWNPDEELTRVRATPVRRSWPAGATAGIALVALGCAGLVATLYCIAGPREVIADEALADGSGLRGQLPRD
jgi:hypothetical protein